MKSNKANLGRMSMGALAIHVVIILGLGQIIREFTPNYMMITFILYAAATILLKQVVPKSHRDGMQLVKQGKYLEAISEFKQSYEFFGKNSWIDKYRAVTMLSVSPMTYREMSLINIAFCYSQIGHGDKAVVLYEKVIKDYPDNPIAPYALNMLKSVQGDKTVQSEKAVHSEITVQSEKIVQNEKDDQQKND